MAPIVTCKTPHKNEQINAALVPPTLFANTAIVALSKNTGTKPVIMSIGDLKTSNPIM